MKDFRTQYIECRRDKQCVEGPLLKFKDNPHLLPHPVSKAARSVAAALKKNPDEGMKLMLCLRFGGNCNSGQPKCKELRANSLDETTNLE